MLQKGEHRYTLEVLRGKKGWSVDAEHKGGEVRYINSLHQPNVAYETWWVKGEPRIAVRALRDIKAGEELFADYDDDKEEQEVCRCGEDNCTGIIGKRMGKEARRMVDEECETEMQERPVEVSRAQRTGTRF